MFVEIAHVRTWPQVEVIKGVVHFRQMRLPCPQFIPTPSRLPSRLDNQPRARACSVAAAAAAAVVAVVVWSLEGVAWQARGHGAVRVRSLGACCSSLSIAPCRERKYPCAVFPSWKHVARLGDRYVYVRVRVLIAPNRYRT